MAHPQHGARHRDRHLSGTYWVDVEGRTDDDPAPGDHSFVLVLESELAGLAERLDVAPLRDFQFDELIDDDGDACWFAPLDSLRTVTALRTALEADRTVIRAPKKPSCAHWVDEAFNDLVSMESALRSAADAGKRFRLLRVG